MTATADRSTSTPARADRVGERGSVLAIVGIGIFVLFGAAALAIDGGRLLEERRATQNAVDHAATAAAYSTCTGGSVADAQAAGLAAAAVNGYDNDGVSNSVSVLSKGSNEFDASITSHVPGTFSRLIGMDSFAVGAQATADCIPGGPGGGATAPMPDAVFAGGDTCPGFGKRQLDVSGSFQTMIGGVHTNGNAYVATAPNYWTDNLAPPDPFTYTVSLDANQSGNVYDATYPSQLPAKAWPTGFGPTDVAGRLATYKALAQANPSDNLYYVNGDIDSAYMLARGTGLYYATGNIYLSFSNRTMELTLVAESEVSISGSNNDLSPFRDDLLAFAGRQYAGADRCDKFTVSVSGSNNTWIGLMWAPYGLLEMAGQNNSSVSGWLLGWAIRLNGSNITIQNQGTGITTGSPQVLLER